MLLYGVVVLLPFIKYPANPPAIGHSFTIHTRGALYLTMVAGSLILLGLAAVGTGGREEDMSIPRYSLTRSQLSF